MEIAIQVKERPIPMRQDEVRGVLGGRKTQVRRVMKPQPDPRATHFEPWLVDGVRQYRAGNGRNEEWYQEGEDMPANALPLWIGHIPPNLHQEWRCPYGAPGDLLWVRETWATSQSLDNVSPAEIAVAAKYAGYKGDPVTPLCDLWYVADMHYRQWGDTKTALGRSRPSIHMPRWASRIQLEITDVRVERVQDISEEDAAAEGISCVDSKGNHVNPNEYEYRKWYLNYADQKHSFMDPVASFWSLWDSINKKRGFGWDDDPWVWVVEFHRP